MFSSIQIGDEGIYQCKSYANQNAHRTRLTIMGEEFPKDPNTTILQAGKCSSPLSFLILFKFKFLFVCFFFVVGFYYSLQKLNKKIKADIDRLCIRMRPDQLLCKSSQPMSINSTGNINNHKRANVNNQRTKINIFLYVK